LLREPFDSIKQGLQEAIAHAEGHGRGVRVHRPRPVDVKGVGRSKCKYFSASLSSWLE
jgi:hypothetical protein